MTASPTPTWTPRPGDRVTVSAEGLVATGTISHLMGYHWHTIKGHDIYQVVLDGTEALVEVRLARLAPTGKENHAGVLK